MKIIFVFLLCISLTSFISCKAKKHSLITTSKTPLLYTDIIYGKVKLINHFKKCTEIVLEEENNMKFKVLISKFDTHKFNFKIGKKYTVKANKLLKINNESTKMIINGKEVIIAPHFRVERCIYFYGQEFCETYIDIYEGLELMH
jgi:hypothetical protein